MSLRKLRNSSLDICCIVDEAAFAGGACSWPIWIEPINSANMASVTAIFAALVVGLGFVFEGVACVLFLWGGLEAEAEDLFPTGSTRSLLTMVIQRRYRF